MRNSPASPLSAARTAAFRMPQPAIRPRAALLAAAAMLFAANAAQAQSVTYHADMTAAQEVVPSHSSASGVCDATLDTASMVLSYRLSWSGMTGPVTMAHLHGPAPRGGSAPVVHVIGMGVTSPVSGQVTLTPAQAADLAHGLYYCNLHSAAYPKGELRGQLEAR